MLDQRGQESSNCFVLAFKLAVVGVASGTNQGGDPVDSLCEHVARDQLEQRGSQSRIRHVGIKQHLTSASQRCRRLVEILQRAQTSFLFSPDRLAKQLTQKRFQHLHGVVLCRCFQAMRKGRERGQAPQVGQPCDRADFGGACESGQSRDARGRNARRAWQLDAEISNCGQPHQRLHQRIAADVDRPRAQAIEQRVAAACGDGQQVLQLGLLGRIDPPGQ